MTIICITTFPRTHHRQCPLARRCVDSLQLSKANVKDQNWFQRAKSGLRALSNVSEIVPLINSYNCYRFTLTGHRPIVYTMDSTVQRVITLSLYDSVNRPRHGFCCACQHVSVRSITRNHHVKPVLLVSNKRFAELVQIRCTCGLHWLIP